MNLWRDKDFPIIVSCAKTLAPWTEMELVKLGYSPIDKSENYVVVKGALRDVFRLNLWLRTAHRVLVPLFRGQTRHVRELYDKVGSIDWENLIDADGYVTVSSVVHDNDSVRDTRMPSLVVKDAIVDRIRMKTGRRPDSGGDYDRGACVFVHWTGDTSIVYIDTSGAPLSKRGYRKIPGSAPMQETLAAACIDAMEWDGTSPFVSPMCGSGTPAIEAALKAMNRAPGSLRARFGFMGIKGYNQIIPGEKAPKAAPRQRFGVSPELIFKDMLIEAGERERKETPPIIATDISPEAIQNAQINAHAAGVFNLISFSACDFADTDVSGFAFSALKSESKAATVQGSHESAASADSSLATVQGSHERAPHSASLPAIFFNPEYGIRLGDPEELKLLYDRIGQFLADKCRGMRGGLITGNPDLAREVNLKYTYRVPFYNGPIDCRLFVYDL